MKQIHFFLATGGFSGYFPKIPGTFGTLVGLFLFYPMAHQPLIFQAWGIFLLFLAGVWSSFHVEKALNQTDPSIIVIDEIVGVWIALFLIPVQWKTALAGFILFRFFDIRKPFPIRHLQTLKGGWGVMLDDCLAGVFTNLILRIFLFYWPGIH